MNSVMDNFHTTSILTLLEPQILSHSSTIKRNRILIKAFFSLIILLALITGAMIVNLIHNHNVAQRKLEIDQQTESVQVFCSMTRHPDSCLSSILIPQKKTSPDDIFNASLRIAIEEVTGLTFLTRALILKSAAADPGLLKCSSLIDDSLNQLNGSLASSAELPLFAASEAEEMRVRDKIRDMKIWVNGAWRDLWSCFGMLGEEQSTAAVELRSGVHNAIVYVSNIYDFLESRDDILHAIHFQQRVRMANFEDGFDYFSALILFFPQYFVLIYLLCLFFRSY